MEQHETCEAYGALVGDAAKPKKWHGQLERAVNHAGHISQKDRLKLDKLTE